MQWANLALFLTEAIVYFSVMTAFLHYRHILGIGVFLTALGVMHFLETYLRPSFTCSCLSVWRRPAPRSFLPAS